MPAYRHGLGPAALAQPAQAVGYPRGQQQRGPAVEWRLGGVRVWVRSRAAVVWLGVGPKDQQQSRNEEKMFKHGF